MAAALTDTPAITNSLQLSFPLPNSPDSKVYLQLTNHQHAIVLYLTTSGQTSGGSCPMGSFVYAIPNVSSFHS
jgi:hypothetical protein